MPPSTRPLAEQLLARAFPPSTAHDLFLNKVRHKPLALCPTPANNNNTNNNDNNARTARRLKRQQHCTRPAATKPRPLSARARRQLRAHAAPLTAGARAPYAAYVPLARLWHAYIRELLGVRADSAAAAEEEAGEEGNGSAKPKPKAWAGPVAASRLCSADFHGAEVLVVQARCVARVGVQGIVVRDSRAAFVVVTRAGDVKLLPKEFSVFRVLVEVGEVGRDWVFEVRGGRFCVRPVERAVKKWKVGGGEGL